MGRIGRIAIVPRTTADQHIYGLLPKDQRAPSCSTWQSAAKWYRTNDIPVGIRDMLADVARWTDATLLHAVLEYQRALPEVGHSIPDAVAFCRIEGGLGIIVTEAKAHDGFGYRIIDERPSSPGQTARLDTILSTLGLCRDRHADVRLQLIQRAYEAIALARDYGAPEAWMIVHSFVTAGGRVSDFQRFAEALGCGRLHPGEASRPIERDGVTLRVGWAVDTPSIARRGDTKAA